MTVLLFSELIRNDCLFIGVSRVKLIIKMFTGCQDITQAAKEVFEGDNNYPDCVVMCVMQSHFTFSGLCQNACTVGSFKDVSI